VGFNPFKYYIKKGTKAHRGRGFASRPFKPSAEADGKRELATQCAALSVCSLINQHFPLLPFLFLPLSPNH
jgi:hypothetical protein